MKQFLYLDTDTVDSIIAQHDNGIILEREQKSGNEDNNELESKTHTGIDGEAKLGIHKLLELKLRLFVRMN